MGKLKEKVFFIIVMVALGIIFIPMFFSKMGTEKTQKAVPAVPQLRKEEARYKEKSDKLLKLEKQLQEEETSALKPVKPPESKTVKKRRKSEALKQEENADLLETRSAVLPNATQDPTSDSVQIEVPAKNQPEKQEGILRAKPKLKGEVVLQHEDAAVPQEEVAQTKKPKKKKRLSEKQLGVEEGGWVIQLGTFAIKAHADELLRKLRSAGYPSYTTPFFSRGGEFTVVFVGPQARLEDAKRIKEVLEARYRLQAELKRYTPGRND